MHAIQTSGNCVRNVTADHLAGIAPDEVDDPRPYCEIIRQWATLHPEFTYLPRKFKIAVTGSPRQTAPPPKCTTSACTWCAMPPAALGFQVLVGGGLGRTPIIGQVIREFLPRAELLAYLEAILRVYNRQGRRDNIHKARIKILVKALGIERFRELVEAEWQANREHAPAPAARGDRARARASSGRSPTRSCSDIDVTARPRAALPGLVPLQHARARSAATARCSSR